MVNDIVAKQWKFPMLSKFPIFIAHNKFFYMKRIYLLMILLVASAATTYAQTTTNLRVINNVSAGASIVANNGSPYAYIFNWRFINDGPIALTATDTIHLKPEYRTPSNPYNLLLPATGLPVNDTVYFSDTVNITASTATSSSNNTSYQWCDSVWAVAGGTGAIKSNPTNNQDCDIVTFAIWKTDINEADAKVQTLHVYPNPATSVVNVKYNFGSNSRADVVIRNVIGKVVYNKDLGKVSGEQQFSLDVSNLSAGIYMVELHTNGKKAVEKITIQ